MKFLSRAALAAGLIFAAGQIVSSESALAAVINDAGDPLLAGASVITFDEVPVGTTDPTIGDVTFTGDTAPVRIMTFGPGASVPVLGNPTGGLRGTPFSIEFDTPVYSFAMNIIDLSNFPLEIQALDDVGALLGSVEFSPGLGNVMSFYTGLGGFSSTIAAVRFESRDLFGIDNLAFTTSPPPVAVTEPATLALFGLGLAGLGFARRVRKTS